MHIRILFIGLVILLGLGTFQARAESLRIGYQKYGTLVLLKARGQLESRLAARNVQVQWFEFPGGPQLLEALNAGAIDFGTTGEAPPIFAQAAGADLLYVANEPPAPAGEAILVQKNASIPSVAELKGKKVALNKGSNVHFLLVRALEEAGLSIRDITPVYLPPADGRAAFESGQVAAWAIWDPFQAAAEQQLQARTLRDGTGLVANHQFYLAARHYADRHPEVIRTLIQEIRDTGAWITRHPEEATALVAPLLGLPAAITRISIARQGYGARLLTPEVIAAQQRIADTFSALRLIPKPLNIRNAVWMPETEQGPERTATAR
mgnify:CR=1 FL=1